MANRSLPLASVQDAIVNQIAKHHAAQSADGLFHEPSRKLFVRMSKREQKHEVTMRRLFRKMERLFE